jgi:hypothetical protein
MTVVQDLRFFDRVADRAVIDGDDFPEILRIEAH